MPAATTHSVGPSPPVDLGVEPVTCLRHVGPQLAERLRRLGIETLQDLLFHLPLRYEDRTRVTAIGALKPGRTAVVEGEVLLCETVHRRRRMLLVRLADGSGALTLRFFHFYASQQASFTRGARLRCYGEVRAGIEGPEIIHPECHFIVPDSADTLNDHLTPIYPSTQGLAQARLRALISAALTRLDPVRKRFPELLPSFHRGLPSLDEALHYVHNPPPDAPLTELAEGLHPAQRRLAFEELLAHHLSLRRLRHRAERSRASALPAGNGKLVAGFIDALPFDLTGAQRRVSRDIFRDLEKDRPMMRMLQGDVGSGKTIVAALAILRAVENGAQTALMVPTELLAEQHFQTLHGWLTPLGVEPVWLSGRLKGRARADLMARLADGSAPLAIGTHALFQAEVEFHRLAFIVIDEQHRFGVHQRLALREKGTRLSTQPHQLIMTATPIPRTLAMTAYADLDTSILDELPPGRTPVRTVVLPATRRAEVVARIRAACAAGRQAYWVCPLIEESEVLHCEAGEETAASLRDALPELAIGLVHGRMKSSAKDAVMTDFKCGHLKLLVATTVIEVGVDVPNASLMIIENAERLGLAQLHQLRGRVGRGSTESACVLLYRAPLSKLARARLAAIRASTDGFVIARRDLELRGPGEVLGTRQTGVMALGIADLMRDADLLPQVQRTAQAMLADTPDDVDALIQRWLGDTDHYAQV